MPAVFQQQQSHLQYTAVRSAPLPQHGAHLGSWDATPREAAGPDAVAAEEKSFGPAPKR